MVTPYVVIIHGNIKSMGEPEQSSFMMLCHLVDSYLVLERFEVLS